MYFLNSPTAETDTTRRARGWLRHMALNVDEERLFLRVLPLTKDALILLGGEMHTHVYAKIVQTLTLERASYALESSVGIVCNSVTL